MYYYNSKLDYKINILNVFERYCTYINKVFDFTEIVNLGTYYMHANIYNMDANKSTHAKIHR